MEITLQDGLYTYNTPTKPPDHQIPGYDKSIEEMHWHRTIFPSKTTYDKLTKPEKMKLQDNELERRIDGHWFYNYNPVKKEPEAIYITGDHYFFMDWWNMLNPEDGNPIPGFRISQRNVFYFLDLVHKDNNCLGATLGKPRRYGVSNMIESIILNHATYEEDSRYGMQSKTGDDARDVNYASIIHAFGKLTNPPFDIRTNTNTNPKKRLEFKNPSIRITQSNFKRIAELKEKMGDNLDNTIDYQDTTVDAYDGPKMKIIHLDEYSKWKEARPSKAFRAYTKTVTKGNGKIVYGKIYATSSSAEEDTKAFDDWCKLIRDSDTTVRTPNGRTASGLYYYFISSIEAAEGYIDKYGFCDEEGAERWVLNQRQSFLDEGDNEGYQAEVRQTPINKAESLRRIGANSTFDNMRLGDKYERIQTQVRKDYAQGDWAWAQNIKDSAVVFNESPFGKVLLNTKVRIERNMINRVQRFPDQEFCPYPDSPMVEGIDPFKFDKTIRGGSKGAGIIMQKWNYIDDLHSNKIISVYRGRPASTDLFFEDMIMQAYFFGARCLSERINSDIYKYFERRGYGQFMMVRPPETKTSDYNKDDYEKGVPANKRLTALGCGLISNYFRKPTAPGEVDNLEEFVFDNVLDDLMKFDPSNTKPFDLTMALIYTLVAAGELKLVKQNINTKDLKEGIDAFFGK